LLQQRLQAKSRSSQQPLRQQLLHLLQPLLHLLWPQRLQPLSQPQAGSMPQLGAGAAQVGAGAAQVGAGAAQVGAAQLGAGAAHPQFTALAQPLLQQRSRQRDLQQDDEQQLVSQPQPL
jgi:hypothetical protein